MEEIWHFCLITWSIYYLHMPWCIPWNNFIFWKLHNTSWDGECPTVTTDIILHFLQHIFLQDTECYNFWESLFALPRPVMMSWKAYRVKAWRTVTGAMTQGVRKQFAPPKPLISIWETGVWIITLKDCKRRKWGCAGGNPGTLLDSSLALRLSLLRNVIMP